MAAQLKYITMIFVVLALSACATGLGGGRLNVAEMYTGRDFLIGGQPEKESYGLYSYLIFGSPPTIDMEQRYKAAVRAYLSYPTVSDSEVYLPKEKLNIFYLLVGKRPPSQILECLHSQCSYPEEEHIRWIIENYDYARGNIILRNISGSLHYGPYIVTARQPISPGTAVPVKQVMIQDMTQVPHNLVGKWVRIFLDKATGHGSAYSGLLDRIRWILLNEIEKFASELPNVASALMYIKTIISRGALNRNKETLLGPQSA